MPNPHKYQSHLSCQGVLGCRGPAVGPKPSLGFVLGGLDGAAAEMVRPLLADHPPGAAGSPGAPGEDAAPGPLLGTSAGGSHQGFLGRAAIGVFGRTKMAERE